MPCTISVCVKCYHQYTLGSDECLLLPSMHAYPDYAHSVPKKVLRTWVDWVEHLSNYCPDCRLAEPPASCMRDLEYHKGKRNE